MYFLDQVSIPENSVNMREIVAVAIVVIIIATAAVFLIDHFTNKHKK